MCRVVLLVMLLCGTVVACVMRNLQVVPVNPNLAPISITSPVKAHLTDGSTVVYQHGVTVADGRLSGVGLKHNLSLSESERVSFVELDQVAAMESFQTEIDAAATGAVTLGVVGGALGSTVLLKAIFGSCPTLYTYDSGHPILQAESFSYSIAPVFEGRDVDRLARLETASGTLKVEVRNEALETHYINAMTLLEVVHDAAESVYPDPAGRALAVAGPNIPYRSVDRDGRPAAQPLHAADGLLWESSEERLTFAAEGADFEDFIDLEFDSASVDQQFALVLRLRNTLLSTVLLYDIVLKSQGFGALDWMGQSINQPLAALHLASWYRSRMGMRISVFDGERYVLAAHLPDQGPIAWKDLAVPLPVSTLPTTRVRLSFVADNWHVDLAEVLPHVRRVETREIAPNSVRNARGESLPDGPQFLSGVDGRYLVTRPGERYTLEYDRGAQAESGRRSWMLAAHGYYIEWMRKQWLDHPNARPLEPGDALLAATLSQWQQERSSYRERFESTRIPVL